MMKKPFDKHKQADQRNLFYAVVLSAVLVIAWQALVEAPKRKELAKWNAQQEQTKALAQKQEAAEKLKNPTLETAGGTLPRAARIGQSPRLPIHSDRLDGSVALKGLRFDDLNLARYRVSMEPGSEEVTLLSPAGGEDSYFAQIGWLAGAGVRVPDEQSLWRADKAELRPGVPVTFAWDNGQGQKFLVTATLDEHYMFTLKQRVENHGAAEISVTPYAYLNRTYGDEASHAMILHEGPIGVLDGTLSEIKYSALREEGAKQFDEAAGWFGFTDKYWLAALVPAGSGFKAEMSHYVSKNQHRYQAQYSGQPLAAPAGGSAENTLRLFAGAKEIGVLDAYAKGKIGENQPTIPLFDRAVDFGALYFLTKPMMNYLLVPFYHMTGNFGIAIILLTIVVKLCMFPLANKGYKSTTQMRALQPEMAKLKETHGKDRVRMQQELVALYKREKVNPAAGCLPILVQIPVFFALYKVLYVTIEMRHAPFYGWLKDLSAPDPSNIFTLFGLIPLNMPSALHIGVLPILMGATMWLQMRQQPKPSDPTQARVMSFMPFFLTFVLASMPAGLVLYWTWSNTLSILQQWVITRRYNAAHPAHQAV